MAQISELLRPNRLQEYIEKLDASGYEIEKLDKLHDAARQKEELVKHLHEIDPSLNGSAEHLATILPIYRQENRAKKEWTTWDYLKAPFSGTWNFMKRHPKTSIFLGAAAVGALLYYTGWGAQAALAAKQWLQAKLIPAGIIEAKEAIAAGTEVVAEGATAATETVTQGVAAAQEAAPGLLEQAAEVIKPAPEIMIPPVTPTPVPLTEVPLTDEAGILEALQQSIK